MNGPTQALLKFLRSRLPTDEGNLVLNLFWCRFEPFTRNGLTVVVEFKPHLIVQGSKLIDTVNFLHYYVLNVWQ